MLAASTIQIVEYKREQLCGENYKKFFLSYSIISASPGNNCVYQVRVRQGNKNETSKN